MEREEINDFPWKDTGFTFARSVPSLQPIQGHSQSLFPYLQNEDDIASALVSAGLIGGPINIEVK